MSENKECLFYIDHNPPEYSGTWVVQYIKELVS